MYIDGTYKTQDASAGDNLTNTRPLFIGKDYSSVYFTGSVDDVRIYNAAMSASQIQEQYYVGLNNLLANGGITNEEYRKGIKGIAIK
jgi:hypothetical protein